MANALEAFLADRPGVTLAAAGVAGADAADRSGRERPERPEAAERSASDPDGAAARRPPPPVPPPGWPRAPSPHPTARPNSGQHPRTRPTPMPPSDRGPSPRAVPPEPASARVCPTTWSPSASSPWPWVAGGGRSRPAARPRGFSLFRFLSGGGGGRPTPSAADQVTVPDFVGDDVRCRPGAKAATWGIEVSQAAFVESSRNRPTPSIAQNVGRR